MFRRAVASAAVAPVARRAVVQQRWSIKQSNQEDDMTWLESDRKLTPEEKWAFQKQQALLKKHYAELHSKHEDLHQETRAHVEEHHNKQTERIAALEKQLGDLAALIKEMKKQ